MARKVYEETHIANIACAIRERTGKSTTYNTFEMAGGIDEVFESGKNEILFNSKYLEKQATGNVIALNDVSEVYHKVKVYADEPTEVDVYGKNLFNNELVNTKSRSC